MKTEKQTTAEARYHQNISELWKAVQQNAAYRGANGSVQQGELRFNLVLIAANHFAYQDNLKRQKKPPFPTDDEISKYAAVIENSKTFDRLMQGKMEWLDDKTKSPADFIKDYMAVSQQLQEKEKKEESARAEFENKIMALWTNVKAYAQNPSAEASREREDWQLNLALIAANYIAYGRNVRNQKNPPFPTEEEAFQFLEGVRKSETFDRLLKGKKEWLGKGYRDFLQEFYNVDQKITEERQNKARELAPYKIPEAAWERRRLRLLRVSVVLRGTGTGSYTGLDAISRSKNSDSFDDALDEITKTALTAGKAPSPEKLKDAVEAVCEYLKGKEKKRTREFGRQRWTGCMRFLADTMPRADFEKYCEHVNEVRGVKPGHPDYVSPETLYPAVVDKKYVIDDTLSRIQCGQNTLRDYARLVAASRIGTNQNSAVPAQRAQIDNKQRMQLCVETENLQKDPNFASFVNSLDKQKLGKLLEKDAAGFSRAWETRSKQLQAQAPQIGQPQSGQALH